ncbi:hypothetical protein QOT17_017762 [Balamuthia mandrillaris]
MKDKLLFYAMLAVSVLGCLTHPVSAVIHRRQEGSSSIPEGFRMEDEPFLLETNKQQIRLQRNPNPKPDFLIVPKDEEGDTQEQYWVVYENYQVQITGFPAVPASSDGRWRYRFLVADTPFNTTGSQTLFVTKTPYNYTSGGITVGYEADVFKYTVASNWRADDLPGESYTAYGRVNVSQPLLVDEASREDLGYKIEFKYKTPSYAFIYTGLNFSVNDGEPTPVTYTIEQVADEKEEVRTLSVGITFRFSSTLEFDPSIEFLLNESDEQDDDDSDAETTILIAVLVPVTFFIVGVILVAALFFACILPKKRGNTRGHQRTAAQGPGERTPAGLFEPVPDMRGV